MRIARQYDRQKSQATKAACIGVTEYAQVIKMLGNGRLEALCFDGEKRLAHIRGKMRKKVRWQRATPKVLLAAANARQRATGLDQPR